MFESLVALLFLSRDYGHRAHLRTKSYAAHMALQSFYEDITDLADRLTECYQGRNGLIEIPYLEGETATDQPVAVLEKHLQLLEGTRYQAVPKEETALQNIIDEAVAAYLRALYKLKTFQ